MREKEISNCWFEVWGKVGKLQRRLSGATDGKHFPPKTFVFTDKKRVKGFSSLYYYIYILNAQLFK